MPRDDDQPATESIALRAFALLEQIVHARAPMSLDELTLALGLPKPTVYRIINLLKDASLLRREPAGKRYSVGPRLTTFAIDLWRSDALRAPWRGALEAVVAEIGESCNLTLLENHQVLYLDRVETSRPLRLHLEAGTRVPLHCTASGKLFLCRMSEAEARRLLGPEPYERFTETTITSFDELQHHLRETRETHIGTHDCERFDDSVAIAVPVYGRRGEIIAAVAMHAPSSRESLQTCRRFVPALQRAAGAIAATMLPQAQSASAAPAAAKRVARKNVVS